MRYGGKQMAADRALGEWIRKNPGKSFAIFAEGEMHCYAKAIPKPNEIVFCGIDEMERFLASGVASRAKNALEAQKNGS